jgi:hypothetical protein
MTPTPDRPRVAEVVAVAEVAEAEVVAAEAEVVAAEAEVVAAEAPMPEVAAVAAAEPLRRGRRSIRTTLRAARSETAGRADVTRR